LSVEGVVDNDIADQKRAIESAMESVWETREARLMTTRILTLLFILSLLSCRTANDETKLPNDKRPVSQEEAIVIAKQEFEKNLPGALWSYDVISRPEENGRWPVLFAGYGLHAGPGSVYVIFVDKNTRKPKFVPVP